MASMAKELTKTQIDRLGDRLKKGNITEADLRLLDQYRRSFTPAYEIVVGTIRKDLALEPTGRPAKSTTSISDKLRRESIRLTQIQDIAGCRLTVTDIAEQDSVVQTLTNLFDKTTIVDRRQRPSHGYRAVHVIVSCLDKMIEIQVRTSLQHLWAELSEKLSDIVDPAIKYGAGDESMRSLLEDASTMVVNIESLETALAKAKTKISLVGNARDAFKQLIVETEEKKSALRQRAFKILREVIEIVKRMAGENNDLSD
jgi:ppGpp synthetase/RelA/SpoT-type nucleotidyltranferase